MTPARVALLVLLFGLSCRPDFPSLEGQQLVCLADAECPDGSRCHPALLRCFDALPECATERALLPDGTPCGGGARVCVAGACARSECGDGVVDPRLDEECDGSEGCHASCLLNVCGDGIVLGAEVCDDGNTVSGDGCRGDCLDLEACPDGQLDEGEECDDGNENPSDRCSPDCVQVRWTSDILTGLGPFGEQALETPIGIGGDFDAQTIAVFLPQEGLAQLEGDLILLTLCQIFRLNSEGQLRPIAGTPGCAPGEVDPGALALTTRLEMAGGMAVDRSGRLHFIDYGQGFPRVLRLEPDGTLRHIAGGGFFVADQRGDGGSARGARFLAPLDLAFDALGRLYVVDFLDHRVRRVDVDGTIETFAGTEEGQGGDGGPANAAQLSFPAGLDFTSEGTAYLAEIGSNRIRVIFPDGQIDLFAGAPAVLDAGLSPTPSPVAPPDQPLTDARPQSPFDVVVDDDRVCWPEAQRNIVRCAEDDFVTTVAGTGEPGFSGDGGPALDARLRLPRALLFDDEGRLVIADRDNQRVRRVDLAGTLSTIAGNGLTASSGDGVPGLSFPVSEARVTRNPLTGELVFANPLQGIVYSLDASGLLRRIAGAGNGGEPDGATALEVRLDRIEDLAYDSQGRLLILDRANHALRRVETDGSVTTLASGQSLPSNCESEQLLRLPRGIDVRDDEILIADEGNHCVRLLRADGTLVRLAGTGDPGAQDLGASDPLTTPLQFVVDVAFDDDGGFFLAESGEAGTHQAVIRHVDAAGVLRRVAGGGQDQVSDPVNALDAQLRLPVSLAFDPDGGLVFTDSLTAFRVRRLFNGEVTTVAGRHPDSVAPLLQEDAPATSVELTSPFSVHSDESGLLIGQRNEIRAVENGLIRTLVAPRFPAFGDARRSIVARASAFALVAGALFVTSERPGHLSRVTFDGPFPDRVEVLAGYPGGASLADDDRAAFARLLEDATGIAFDGGTKLYLSEQGRGLVMELEMSDPDPRAWTLRELTDAAVGPAGLALFGGELFIADELGHQVLAVSLAAPDTARVVYGVPGVPGVDGEQLIFPVAVAFDSAGALFVADAGHRVVRVDASGAETVIGTGLPSPFGEGAVARETPIEDPRGLSFDSSGNLLVTSTRSVRLVVAGPDGRVDGDQEVLQLFPNAGDPLSDRAVCLSDVAEIRDGLLAVGDRCASLIFELRRLP